MGDAIQSGAFFDRDIDATKGLGDLMPTDIDDIYNTSPDRIAYMIEKAHEAENPELALFVTGILAARTIEKSHRVVEPRFGSRRSRDSEETYTARDYKTALRGVLTTMASLEPLIGGGVEV